MNIKLLEFFQTPLNPTNPLPLYQFFLLVPSYFKPYQTQPSLSSTTKRNPPIKTTIFFPSIPKKISLYILHRLLVFLRINLLPLPHSINIPSPSSTTSTSYSTSTSHSSPHFVMTQPNKWLIAYNLVSASLWTIVLVNTLLLTLLLGQPFVFDKTQLLLTIVQCGAVIEIVNAATGVVKSPLFTTTAQVFLRLLIVLGILQVLPDSPANTHWAYISLCLAWSFTEVVRYSYYASHLANLAAVPYWLTWLRYSAFYVLYPIGVASEMTMIYKSLEEAEFIVGSWYKWALFAILFTYPPGLYTLYTYMIRQRKKVLHTKKE